VVRVDVLTEGATILPGHAAKAATILGRILAQRGIGVHMNSKVVGIEPGSLCIEGGGRLAADHVIIATGAAAPSWIAASGIETDEAGFIAVNAFLQSLSHPNIFAAGDIASITGCPAPKSGVYAVRQGPALAANLRRALEARPLVRYVPQRSALALISTGNRYAVASYGDIVFAGAWVWRWKDALDRRFMARYRRGSM
jgi:selenide,water dikinase